MRDANHNQRCEFEDYTSIDWWSGKAFVWVWKKMLKMGGL